MRDPRDSDSEALAGSPAACVRSPPLAARRVSIPVLVESRHPKSQERRRGGGCFHRVDRTQSCHFAPGLYLWSRSRTLTREEVLRAVGAVGPRLWTLAKENKVHGLEHRVTVTDSVGAAEGLCGVQCNTREGGGSPWARPSRFQAVSARYTAFLLHWRASLPLLYSDGEQVCTLARAASFRPPGDGERG